MIFHRTTMNLSTAFISIKSLKMNEKNPHSSKMNCVRWKKVDAKSLKVHRDNKKVFLLRKVVFNEEVQLPLINDTLTNQRTAANRRSKKVSKEEERKQLKRN